ncbi:hypothetical protein LSUE1_G009159 [Lachnellula suecica]|uniref:Acetylserotonin methytransferase-like protein n=1 Tax=Lachnellula suecica TaxID=602035 RepID=A0A8T9BX57_9HELO|nr:hypothetical protein LSUE1_G009159 [Lachnellula suecica]
MSAPAQQAPVNMGLQLFPPPPKRKSNPSRKPSTRRNAINPQSPPQSAVDRPESPSFAQDGRQSALGGRSTPQPTSFSQNGGQYGGRSTPQPDPFSQTEQRQYSGGRSTPQPSNNWPIAQPSQAHIAAEIPRSQTSFSEAPTLVRNNSNSSHNSIAKNGMNGSPQRGEPVMRSIFPKYNPDLPLEHQPYFPTQTSPTHIPKTIINRRPYSPSIHDVNRSPAGLQSPMSVGSPGRFPRGVLDESIMEPSSTEELKELWKVTNGWRVSASEGRSFCLKMASHPEEPIHTLSSATQTFYTLRIVPTSTSAHMTMTRQDPTKPAASSSPRIGSSSKSKDSSMEVMGTPLEETARRLPPNDGLVALLYPKAAANMAIDMASKPHRADSSSVIAAAERECGRLVWDEDSQKYYLVHPAVSNPFVISISSSPAWSRVEYTLEHPELPHNIVRLVRDGAGTGFLEVDTSVASRIDAFYIVDVAICAVLLTALEEEKTRKIEHFEAPPAIRPASPQSPKSSKWKRTSKTASPVKREEFELDLESQDSLKGKREKGKEDKIPGFFGLVWMLVKCFVWVVTMVFKALAKIMIFLSKCLTRKS